MALLHLYTGPLPVLSVQKPCPSDAPKIDSFIALLARNLQLDTSRPDLTRFNKIALKKPLLCPPLISLFEPVRGTFLVKIGKIWYDLVAPETPENGHLIR